MKVALITSLFLCYLLLPAYGQIKDDEDKNRNVEFFLNDSKTHSIRFNGLAQIWLRNTQMNPGTTIYGNDSDSYSEISIRRLRFQVYGQVTDRIFFYTQFGMNNFNYHSAKFQGAFFHDAVVEYKVSQDKLSIGGGLTSWGGPTRYASPGIGGIMTLDAPLYQQSTNGVNDQFIRKLSLYVKGQVGKLDYRLVLSQPMEVIGADRNATAPTSPNFSFSNEIAEKLILGYFKYMFLDKESNLTPYQTGTYLGTKSIFNLGVGFSHQGDATWALDENGETIRSSMTLFGIDLFLDKPVSESSTITAYAAYSNTSYGDGFVRYVGVNNSATGGTNAIQGGFGNSFPMHGNGSVVYAQVGYLFGNKIITNKGKLQPFAAIQYGDYDRLSNAMVMYEFGANLLLEGTHNTKISLGYQSRPTYSTAGNDLIFDQRKGMTVIQLQAGF